MIKKYLEKYKELFILAIAAIFIGIIVGVIDTIFGRVLLAITEFRDGNIFKLVPFLPLAGILIIYIYKRIGKNSIKGMTLVFNTAYGEEEKIPKRLVPLVMLSTWITHLFGGSAGREGVAVQIGATVSHTIGRKIKIENGDKILLIAGMAAGFAGLFQTPIAAVLFALEVLVAGAIEYNALIAAIVAAFTASYTSHLLHLEKFSFPLKISINVDYNLIIKLIIIGVIFGITGGLFAYALGYFKKLFGDKLKNPIFRIFILGTFITVLLLILHKGRYCGLGTNLISNSFNGSNIYSYDFILKFVLTILTLSAGYQGGEVTPLFSIGSSLGILLGSLFNLPLVFVAALGYAAVFGSATNTFLAPVFIGAEVFGYKYIPYFFVVCAIAYVFNFNKSIYKAQKLNNNLC